MKRQNPFAGRRPVTLAAGLVGSLALALSTNGTLSAFTASITNSANTAASGYIAMRETLLDPAGNPTTTVCDSTSGSGNAATCSSINKYGGTTTALAPGGAAAVTKIAITNTGSLAATAFTLTSASCTATAGTVNGGADPATVCGQFTVTMTSGSTTLYSGSAAGLVGATVDLKARLGGNAIAPGAVVPITISVSLASSVTAAYAGFSISQPLTWTFTA